MTDDKLLVRIDERTRNTYKLMEKLERHQAEQNGYIRENMKLSVSNKAFIKIICGVGGGLLLVMVGGFIAHLQGLW